NLCPVGIDIRDGQHLECIICALCIDACDDVMARIGKPRGLIDYIALTDETAERAGGAPKPIWKHILRPRTIIFTALWAMVGAGLVIALFVRADIDVSVDPVRNPTFVTLSDGSIRNTYDVRILNKNGDDRPFHIHITKEISSPLIVTLEGSEDPITIVPADGLRLQRVYITAPAGTAAATVAATPLRIWVEDMTNTDRAFAETVFNGNGRRQ
ncbi:MAG: FixG Ig-like domain-containing protein, partial [Halocynthiibacter sp.]